MNIAQTILEQLGGRRFIAMTGARDFLDCGNALKFRIPGNIAQKRINLVMITLNGSDLYDVEFGRLWKMNYKPVEKHDDVYFDELQPLFTQVTGMYVRLF
jgi:hypothetical protein